MPPPERAAEKPSGPPRILDALLLGALFAGLTRWSWGKWPDLLVDFGHELYIPWQLSLGKVLQRDIAYIYGPLSPDFNALLFRVFGPSLRVLVFSNLVILAGIVLLLYNLVDRLSDRFTALAAALFFLVVFAFSQYQGVANYNFVAPFTHECTHGTLLALVMLLLLERYATLGGTRSAAGAGIAFGLVFLTRAEIAFASFAAAATLFGLLFVLHRGRRMRIARGTLLFAACAAFPPLLYWLRFIAAGMSPLEAFHGTIGSWHTLSASSVAKSPFYLATMGTDAPIAHAVRMFLSAAVTITAIGAGVLAVRLTRGRKVLRTLLVLLAGTAILALSPRLGLERISFGLPLLLAAAAVLFLVKAFRGRTAGNEDARFIVLTAFTVFALGLLGKVVLNVRFAHYGFYLASPAMSVLVVVLLRYLQRRIDGGDLFHTLASIVLIALAFNLFRSSNAIYRLKDYPVGRAPDTILHYGPETTGTGWVVRNALDWMEENIPEGSTLMALPQGVILNYLVRRANPTPYIQISMTEILLYGEKTILEAMRRKPPDFIAVVHVESGEFGVSYFGTDYRFGSRIMKWVNENYVDAALFGDRPLLHPGFGILMMKRKT